MNEETKKCSWESWEWVFNGEVLDKIYKIGCSTKKVVNWLIYIYYIFLPNQFIIYYIITWMNINKFMRNSPRLYHY